MCHPLSIRPQAVLMTTMKEGNKPTASKRTRKRQRKSKRFIRNEELKQGPCTDLFVPLPSSLAQQKEVFQRLWSDGYRVAAIPHIVYGVAKGEVDHADTVFSTSGHRKTGGSLHILRRLHVVLETASDLAVYQSCTKQSNPKLFHLLNSYDLVSMCPMNEVVWKELTTAVSKSLSASVATTPIFDILTIAPSRTRLPYAIRPAELSALAENLALELHYSSALLQPSHRRAWISTGREIELAIAGSVHRQRTVLLCSGNRETEERDVGILAMRTPADLQNLAKTVLRWSGPRSEWCVKGGPVVRRAEERKFGTKLRLNVRMEGGSASCGKNEHLEMEQSKDRRDTEEVKGERSKKRAKTEKPQNNSNQNEVSSAEDEDELDGFIALD